MHKDYTSPATDSGKNVKITIRNAATIGGTRYDVISKTFSTTESSNTNDPSYSSGIQPGCASVALDVYPTSSTRPYYDAKYENTGSTSLKISLMVGMD